MKEKENKISDSAKRAKTKWAKENTYKRTITFYKKRFPKEKFEIAKEEIYKMGYSLNDFLVSKLEEMANKKNK